MFNFFTESGNILPPFFAKIAALSNKPRMNETKWRQRGGVQKVTFFTIIITRFLVEPEETPDEEFGLITNIRQNSAFYLIPEILNSYYSYIKNIKGIRVDYNSLK